MTNNPKGKEAGLVCSHPLLALDIVIQRPFLAVVCKPHQVEWIFSFNFLTLKFDLISNFKKN